METGDTAKISYVIENKGQEKEKRHFKNKCNKHKEQKCN